MTMPRRRVIVGLGASDASVSAGKAEPTECLLPVLFYLKTNLLSARYADAGQLESRGDRHAELFSTRAHA